MLVSDSNKLIGSQFEILSITQSLGVELDSSQIVDAADDVQCAAQSVDLIRSGTGAMLIKGMLPTGVLLKAVVNRETGIRASEVMSHVAILDVPSYHKLLYVTDGGMVVAPNLEQKRHILKNALDFCRFTKLTPARNLVAYVVAGVVLGARVPITLNSRGAAAEEKYCSILICAAMN